MTDHQLRKLSRKGLLEILVEQAKEIERLEKLNKTLRQQEQTRISYSGAGDVGSLAEEAARVSGILEDAQKAADLYLEEVRQMRAQAKRECEQELMRARQEADEMLEAAEQQISEKKESVNNYIKFVNAKVKRLLEEHPELRPYFNSQER